MLGVGDGIGPFEGGCGASIVCGDEEGEDPPAGVVGAGLASRLDRGVVFPRWPIGIGVAGSEPLFVGAVTLHDASGELVRVCWLSVNIRGEST